MKLKHVFSIVAYTVLLAALSSCASAQTIIASNGKSTYSIVVPAKAPSSVQNAATEFQKDIKIATGAELPLQKEDAKVGTSIISLGNTQQAKAAGISSEKMADESFRIVTKGGNLYILGPDIAKTKSGGPSDGTADGVYAFLEDYLDVRWLMPGDLGRDVPSKSTFTLQNIDRTEAPSKFGMRDLSHITYYANASQYRSINAWMSHQRLGGATNFYYMHNWWKTINNGFGGENTNTVPSAAVEKAYKEHPDWFAMDKNGKRPMPRSYDAKLETTNQELVKWFAEQAVKSLKVSDNTTFFSLSPSDGNGWSQSPESKALYDPHPAWDTFSTSDAPSMSSLVAKWYHDIAQIVAQEDPEGHLSGFLYSSYIYPPQKGSVKLPPNFTPMIAPSHDYGYKLYRDDVQKYFHTVMDDWAKVVTGDWYYYDLPNHIGRQERAVIGNSANFPGNTGIVTPVAPDILNIIFPQLLKSHIKGADIYGNIAWSNGALNNYVVAKMMWNPTLDAKEVEKKWLHRAYGDESGVVMEKFYGQLDGWFRDYYRQNQASYKLTMDMLKDIYGTHYPELEKTFLQAEAQPMTQVQKQRLQLIEDNLIVLQWRLRNVHYLPQSFASPLQRTDAQISDLIAHDNPDIPMFPGVASSDRSNRKLKPLPWKVKFSKSSASTNKSILPKWDDSQFLIYAAKDGDIHISTQMVTNGAYFAAYNIKDQKGKLVKSGVFNKATPIVFSAKSGEAYMLTIPLRKPVNFQLQMQNVAVADGNLQDGTLQLSSTKDAPAYLFYVPGKSPVGVIEDYDNAKIRKPYSGNIAQGYIKNKWRDARSIPLDGGWRFSPDPKNDGLKRGVTKTDFDDSSWTSISPLNWWQFQGAKFADYHGSAWYRLSFEAPKLNKGDEVALFFGAVDGNAEVYLNGKKVGEHTLGKDYKGWDKAFAVGITQQLQPGKNALAVQVTSKSATTASGIFKGVALVVGKHR